LTPSHKGLAGAPFLGREEVMRKYLLPVFIFGFLISALLGCQTLKEGTKGFLGVSTRSLEEARSNAIVKTFSYDYNACYTMAKDILKHMKSYVYADEPKKHMVAFYISEQDTTPVALFFKEIDKANTQVEVSSLSTYAREFISEKVLSVLDKKLTLEELEAQINAKEKQKIK
jgi:hypothetical protein